ncbi:unnamed protein product [Protopolystoma xenopodis]|uniref:Uncharacterized protein n=1 Tax=Protopolystoma xenopodis TaxID=117903 RepID=A0A3S5A7H0_9PLAT|nr:unnamed protein product [Protopolystoma xenopodis]
MADRQMARTGRQRPDDRATGPPTREEGRRHKEGALSKKVWGITSGTDRVVQRESVDGEILTSGNQGQRLLLTLALHAKNPQLRAEAGPDFTSTASNIPANQACKMGLRRRDLRKELSGSLGQGEGDTWTSFLTQMLFLLHSELPLPDELG